MRSTFHGLEVAKRSLFTQQVALNTTGHNIANANTPGYSRQVVDMAASRPLEALGMWRSTAAGQIGMGVDATAIRRVREKFLDDQFRNDFSKLGRWSVEQDTLEKIEAFFNEPSETGFTVVLERFWNAWADLAKDPSSADGRRVLRESAMALADAFNTISRQLTDLDQDLTTNLEVKTGQINTLIQNIADLNRKIARLESLGDHANDLRDQRDLFADELSKLINVTVEETADGVYNVRLGNRVLVEGFTSEGIDVNELTSMFDQDLTGGEIYGMIRSKNVYIAGYLDSLNQLANTLANGEVTVTLPAGTVLPEGVTLKVNGVETTFTGANRVLTSDLQVTVAGINGLHKLGYLMTDPPTTGGDFFVGTTAADFKLNPDIQNNPSLIASSMRLTGIGNDDTVIRGNNTLALIMSELKNTKFTFTDAMGTETSIAAYYRSLVGQLGVQTNEATRQTENMRVIVDQVDARRLSVSGVSLDEEMTNMIKFQHAYSAAARVMTTIDEMLNKIINGMGVVGR